MAGRRTKHQNHLTVVSHPWSEREREREGQKKEREKYRTAVNNSEFLWSGLVCSFGHGIDDDEAAILHEEEQEIAF